MNIDKNLLENVFESKIKEFMSVDSGTLYIKWDLTEEEINAGITKHFYIYYSELIATIKDWALSKNYAIISGINKDVLKEQSNSKNYYDIKYISKIYGENMDDSLTGFNELEVVHDLALKLLKGL